MTQWYDVEFIGSREETKGTNRFWFKILHDSPLEYESGQFFTFDLPTGEKRLDRWRSYTISNAFDGSNIIELCISYKKNGLASEYFFNEINKGDKIKFKGPEGTFILPESKDNSLILLATGTGIAPFRAMLQTVDKQKLSYKTIHLIFGTRKAKDILYLEELEDFGHFINNMKIDICLSRETKLPSSTKEIQYHTGYIHPIYQAFDKKKINESTFMICGWTNMIDEALANLLTKMNVDKKKIKLEMFG